VVVLSFSDGKIAPERMINLPLQQLAPGRRTRLIGRCGRRQGRAVPGGHRGHRRRGLRKTSGWPKISPTMFYSRRRDRRNRKALRPFRERRRALHLSHRLGGHKGWSTRVCRAVEFIEIAELDLAKQTVARKLALLKPSSAIAPGTHPAHSSFRRTARFFTSRFPTAMPLPR